ncbi:hypothetical protein ILYODFUR_038843, partial [Ilyodon furcidens]
YFYVYLVFPSLIEVVPYQCCHRLIRDNGANNGLRKLPFSISVGTLGTTLDYRDYSHLLTNLKTLFNTLVKTNEIEQLREVLPSTGNRTASNTNFYNLIAPQLGSLTNRHLVT